MNDSKCIPNFLIVGTAKAATTTIHEYLKQHPDVYMAEWKEPCFFTFANRRNITFTTGRKVKFVTDLEHYKELFLEGRNQKIRGESSTPYLYFYQDTINNIKKYVPNYQNMKILIVLRNPIERAYSQYMMKVRDLVENMSFIDALRAEKKRMEENAHFDFFYADRGLYYEQVKAYKDVFKEVKIVLHDDFKANPYKVLKEVLEFLDVDSLFQFNKISNKNISGRPRFRIISVLLNENNWAKTLLKPLVSKSIRAKLYRRITDVNVIKEPIDLESRNFLRQYYHEDIKYLETLIQRDLSKWML